MNPLPGYSVTTPYGVPGKWAAGYHTGDDYSTHGRYGVLVYAARAGTVVSTSSEWGRPYGLTLVIEGPAKRVRMGYCHLDAILVRQGQRVERGQLIARTGNSGNSTGPHLHYEERRRPFLYEDHRRPRFNHRP